ncbi:uncharacterized protein BROUX77_001106 [Berkeleyomyces rouxiae]|uniref:uncharacterized protein n=1 Tax=Berkeleyomyces rouxiae TaxID=2035830 RepID=UPI003B7601FA
MPTSPRHTPAGHPIHDSLRQTRGRNASPVASPLVSPHTTWGPFSAGQTLPPPSAQNGHATTAADVNAKATSPSGRSPSPNYFGLVINNSNENTTSSLADGLWQNSLADFHPSTTINTSTDTVPSATPLANTDFNLSNQDMATLCMPRPSFQHNAYQSQAGPDRRPPMARFNTMPSNPTGSQTKASHQSNGPSINTSIEDSSLNKSSGAIATSTTSTKRVHIPRSAMPSFKYSSNTGAQDTTHKPFSGPSLDMSQPQPTHTPMDIDESPFFVNTAPAMNLSLPSGRGFSVKSSATHSTVAMVTTAMPSAPPVRPSLSLKLNLGTPSTSSFTPRATPVSALASSKVMSPQDLLGGDRLRDIIHGDESQLLLLDVRCSQNYANAHIQGALNLCIPTMLLKRENYMLKKVLENFQRPEDIEKLSNWRNVSTIVAYGTCSTEKNELGMASNVLRKFTKEGFTGSTYVLSGGFSSFAEEYPDLITDENASSSDGDVAMSSSNGPIFGGVAIPRGEEPIAPFFSTIRQNLDLINGPGKVSICRPSGIETRRLPLWLDQASHPSNDGKKATDAFFALECNERDRMKLALTMKRSGSSNNQGSCGGLAGFEKGGKNRYKEILPYDHSRVKLHGKVECDYINASYVKSSRSNKRYIASQGPLPGTCDDFWSVIWDQDIRLIVNLTAESERGLIKCHTYWKEKNYGPIQVKLVTSNVMSLDLDSLTRGDIPSKINRARARARANTTMSFESNPNANSNGAATSGDDESTTAIIRYFAISHTGFPWKPIREVVQLHYTGWPDLGAPAQPAHLLALVEMANILNRQVSRLESSPSIDPSTTWQDEAELDTCPRPILVHCSAGCGRTGTFCTVDSVIDMMKRQRLTSMDILGGRAPADTAATAVAAAMGINAPNSPRSSAAAMRSISSVFGSPTSATSRQRSSSTSRRGSSVVTPVVYPPLDTMWMGDESVDLICETVADFRHQRVSMVQTPRQYGLCYEAVMEWISRLNDHCAAGSVVGSRIRPRQGSFDAHSTA